MSQDSQRVSPALTRCGWLLGATLLLLAWAGCQPPNQHQKHNENSTESLQPSADPNAPMLIRANPNIPNLEFQNQDGKTVRLTDLKGKPVLLSFIYTRCPMPTMCPLTTKQFIAVQEALKPEHRKKVALVLLSFDPEYDTPAVLKKYGQAYGVDFSNLQFWTGSKQNVFDLTDSYNMWYKEESGEYAHRTFTVLLKPDGSYLTELRGADWNVAEAVQILTGAIPSP